MTWRIAVIIALAACGHGDDYQVYQPPPDDAAVSCGLVTCASAGATCGDIGDGCGAVTTSCGTCGAGDVCGAGGAFTCGPDPCVPRTCDEAGADCGQISDGCGGITPSCGTCGTGEVCGAGTMANVCATPACTGLCLQQAACPSQPQTTISGTVTAPGHASTLVFGAPDPIYGALVYIPNGAAGPPTYGVKPFTPGVSCDTCSSLVSEPPLVSATTGVDGKFTLANAPCGTNIPLVMQLGRWRREITIPSVACCATTALTAAQTHLPRNRVGEPGDVRSDIPLMAFSTGDVDTLHCVLRKIGIDDSEFTDPSGPGRVHFYTDTGAQIDAATPAATALYGSAAELARYDLTLFECVGERVEKSAADQNRVIAYANAGGRVFATHFSYVWLTDSDGSAGSNIGPKPFSQTATWNVDQSQTDAATGVVDQTLQSDPETQARRVAFASWLSLVGASTAAGQIPVDVVRKDFDAVNHAVGTEASTPAQQWLFTSDTHAPLQYSFDTPIAYAPSPRPTKRCGRVVYSDFHVSDAVAGGMTFPAECSDGPLTPQEKTLEFLLFDLAACVGPQPSACTPRTCEERGYACGLAGDGCDDGVVLNCGGCSDGRFCGGGDAPNTCGTGACVPVTCASYGLDCGVAGDGCGGTIDCGPCGGGEICGGAGVANQCALILK